MIASPCFWRVGSARGELIVMTSAGGWRHIGIRQIRVTINDKPRGAFDLLPIHTAQVPVLLVT